MQLWSLHPTYLDAKGLVALWREGFLALHVLQGKTKGYKHHPQLIRFRESGQPIKIMHVYLNAVLDEAIKREYKFDPTKIRRIKAPMLIPVTKGQLDYELGHLKKKLWQRDRKCHGAIKDISKITPHPAFRIIPGDIEPLERT